jgi:hypothetical protein
MLGDGFGSWQSMSVCFLILSSYSIQFISASDLLRQVIRRLADQTKIIQKGEADRTVRCTSPFCMPITYFLSFTIRKYVEEKTTATLKSKQTIINTV